MTDETAEAVPIVADQIRSWLPDHTHVKREFNASIVWTWTTPDGVWGISSTGVLPGGWINLIGPGGEWRFGQPSPDALRKLRGVLLALGAIRGES